MRLSQELYNNKIKCAGRRLLGNPTFLSLVAWCTNEVSFFNTSPPLDSLVQNVVANPSPTSNYKCGVAGTLFMITYSSLLCLVHYLCSDFSILLKVPQTWAQHTRSSVCCPLWCYSLHCVAHKTPSFAPGPQTMAALIAWGLQVLSLSLSLILSDSSCTALGVMHCFITIINLPYPNNLGLAQKSYSTN